VQSRSTYAITHVADGSAVRLLDLFAGCGGLTQGFVASGFFRPVGAVEWDVHAAATYAMNFGPHVSRDDIRSWRHRSLPFAEVVVGGPPCQGFSALGARRPDDERNDLWWDYLRVLSRVRPAFFLLENVPPFLTSVEYRSLLEHTRPGRELAGWAIEAHVLDASWYGAAQARRRAFVLGRPVGMRPLGAPGPQSRRRVLQDVLAGLPEPTRTQLPSRVVTSVSGSVPGAYRTTELHVTRRMSEVESARCRAVPPGGGRLDLPDDLRLPAWRGSFRGASDVMGRLRWDRPASTLRTEFFRPEKGRFLHPEANRPLTHYEAAVLQGFPDDFLWCGTKASIARQIGNAVPVPMARAWAEHLAAHLVRRPVAA
jgi:DNA (cytosine-5)-methyltransferase 1